MRTAVDTNVLSTLWSGEQLTPRVSAALAQAYDEGGLVISAPVYAELFAYPGTTPKVIQKILADSDFTIDFELDERIWTEAGHRYARYVKRRRASSGGEARRILADFVIGAHALLRADRLLTLDKGCYRQNFSDLPLISI
jgi:hypothetical protein